MLPSVCPMQSSLHTLSHAFLTAHAVSAILTLTF